MKPEDLALVRSGAEVSQMKPYIDAEVAELQKAVVNSVLSAVNQGALTPDVAMAKWMEYISYLKLSQKFSQRIQVGNSVAASLGDKLDK